MKNRLIQLEGCHNFRDLGGYPTKSGETLRWGQLFRADGLHQLSSTDVTHLRDEIGLGDSIGVGTPKSIKELIQACGEEGVPASVLTAHFHNTCGMALANCYAAMEMGVSGG